MNKYLTLIERSFADKNFVARLLHDSIPEYQDLTVEYIEQELVMDEEADIKCILDKNGEVEKIVVNFTAESPDDSGYIGFTVNFVL